MSILGTGTKQPTIQQPGNSSGVAPATNAFNFDVLGFGLGGILGNVAIVINNNSFFATGASIASRFYFQFFIDRYSCNSSFTISVSDTNSVLQASYSAVVMAANQSVQVSLPNQFNSMAAGTYPITFTATGACGIVSRTFFVVFTGAKPYSYGGYGYGYNEYGQFGLGEGFI